MFFYLSKILWGLFSPLSLIGVMICGGALLRQYRYGQRVMLAGIVCLAAFGFLPIGHNLLVYQESRYPPLQKLPDHVDGIIVLGGSIDFKKSLEWGQGQLNDLAPRITEMIVLAHQYPDAKLVFSGGNGNLKKSVSSESIEIDKLLKRMGFDAGRVIYEGQSRNTYENMVFSKEIIRPKQGEVWLLVTSAFHMQRSAAIFNTNGWEVVPYPAGYISNRSYRYYPNLDILMNMYKLQIVTKEWIGMIAYTLTGKIKSGNGNDQTDISSRAHAPA